METTLKIPAIHCDGYVNTIRRALETLPTVQVAQADPESKVVRVAFDEAAIGADRIRECLDEIGFSAEDGSWSEEIQHG